MESEDYPRFYPDAQWVANRFSNTVLDTNTTQNFSGDAATSYVP